jgi:crotonobetainyl-CoA:carnitine CoA-transferase CaiB-like acyl-CoA transferase
MSSVKAPGTGGPSSPLGPSSAFSGLRVVEIADDPAGEHTGKLLADLGATVIKIEPPTGAPSRSIGPFVEGQSGPDASLTFWTYNTSKRSVVLDADVADRAVRDQLIATADILITTAPPSGLAAAGLDLAELVEANERLIALSVTAFGLTGPWAEYRSSDLVALAAGGLLNSCGYDDHTIPPIRPGGNQGYMTAASFAQCGVLLALIERQRSGRGQLVDVSMHEAIAVSGELANPYWFYPKALVKRQTGRHAQPVPTQPAIFSCLDGVYVYFALVLSDPKAWTATVAWMADLDLAVDLVDPRYREYAHRQAEFAHVQELLEVFFAVQDSATVYHEGQRRGLPIAPVLAPEEVLHDEHLHARNFFIELPLPTDPQRSAAFPGSAYQFSGFAARPTRPPRLGEHTVQVLAELAGEREVQRA